MKSYSVRLALLSALAMMAGASARAQFDEPVMYEQPIIINDDAPHYEYRLETSSGWDI